MHFPNIFTSAVIEELNERMMQLKPDHKPLWGKMNAGQMLAHCSVSYEMIFTDKHRKPKGLKKLLIKWFVKSIVVGPKPYKKGSPTAPAFVISDQREVDSERTRLMGYLKRVADMGEKAFDGLESQSFGPLSVNEWNTLFYKHLDYHLKQFGV